MLCDPVTLGETGGRGEGTPSICMSDYEKF